MDWKKVGKKFLKGGLEGGALSVGLLSTGVPIDHTETMVVGFCLGVYRAVLNFIKHRND